MKPTLQEIDAYLKESERHMVGVFDQTGVTRLIKDMDNQSLVEKHGGFIPFLETLYNRGVTTVFVETMVKRGKVIQSRTAAFEYSLSRKQDTTDQNVKSSSSSKSKGSFTGLTGQEYVSKLESDYNRAIRKNKKLKKKLKVYDNTPGLAGQVTDLVANEAFVGNLLQIATAFKGSPQPQGQKQPTTLPQELSPTKEYLINLIAQPATQDSHTNMAYMVLDRVMKGDQVFADLVTGLLNEK